MADIQLKDEMNWQDVRRKPEALIGFSYVYAFLVLLGIGLLYIWNLGTIGRNAVTPWISRDSSMLVQDIPFRSPKMIPPINVRDAGIATPEMIKKGNSLFHMYCVSCHGENGAGDGSSASLLSPKPRNFHVLTGWKNGSKVSQLYKTLDEGIIGSSMASYNYLLPTDRFALIHYIRTLAENQPQVSEDELKQLDALYQLSQGMNIAGQIPVKKAMRIVEKENSVLSNKIDVLYQEVSTSNSSGAIVFRAVSFDQSRALISAIKIHGQANKENEFIRIISSNPVQYGFKTTVVILSEEEWNTLYQYISSIIKM